VPRVDWRGAEGLDIRRFIHLPGLESSLVSEHRLRG